MSIKSSQKLVQEANENIETLSAEEIKSLVEKNEVTLIDVRDIRELWKEGTIKGSKHIPRGRLIDFCPISLICSFIFLFNVTISN